MSCRPDSIRELIHNAVMNCSFLQNSHIQVAIYDDRLEITSPGGIDAWRNVNTDEGRIFQNP